MADWVYKTHAQHNELEDEAMTFDQRISAGIDVVKDIVGKIWIYILIGIAVGAGAHGFVPDAYLLVHWEIKTGIPSLLPF